MEAKSPKDRKSEIIKFAALYGLGIVLLAIIFSSFLKEDAETVLPGSANRPASVFGEATMVDSMLHQQLVSIQVMDRNYSSLLDDKTKEPDARRIKSSIDSAVFIMRTKLDSIARQAVPDSSGRLQHTLAAFTSELDNRRLQEYVTGALVARAAGSGSVVSGRAREDMSGANMLEMAGLQLEIQTLKEKLRAADRSSKMPARPVSDSAQSIAYETLQDKYRKLEDVNTRLRNANDLLNTRAAQADAGAAKPVETNASAAKLSQMQHKIDDLNAEVYFTTVDCNMSRMAVNQIISTSHQRRDLIKQSVDILSMLQNSPNSEVQKRAMNKLDQLNKIVSTVRD